MEKHIFEKNMFDKSRKKKRIFEIVCFNGLSNHKLTSIPNPLGKAESGCAALNSLWMQRLLNDFKQFFSFTFPLYNWEKI